VQTFIELEGSLPVNKSPAQYSILSQTNPTSIFTLYFLQVPFTELSIRRNQTFVTVTVLPSCDEQLLAPAQTLGGESPHVGYPRLRIQHIHIYLQAVVSTGNMRTSNSVVTMDSDNTKFTRWWSCREGETMSLNCGHQRAYCSSPADIWAWRARVEWCWQRKAPNSSTTSLAVLPAASSGSKHEERAKYLRSIFVHTCNWFFYMP
jgi:hypothetical protein